MKKLFLCLSVLLVLLFFLPAVVGRAESESEGEERLMENVEELLNSLDTKELEEYLASLKIDSFDGVSLQEKIVQLIKGGNVSYDDLFSAVWEQLWEKGRETIGVFITILCVCIFDGVILSVRGNFLSNGISDVVHYACFACILSLLFLFLIPQFSQTKQTVEELARQMELIFPLLITLMAGGGGTVSVAIYRPAVAFLSNGIIQMIQNILFPIAILLIGLSVVGSISGKINLGGFVKFFSGSSRWLMGIAFTLYSVCLTVQGIASSTFDGLSLRAAKYAIGSGVPMIGGFLSGGIDLVLAGSILIKNSLGIVAILLLCFTVLEPLLGWIVFSLLLKLTAALASPIADARIGGFLEGLSANVGYFIAGLLAVGFAYFVTVLLFICSSGVIV